MSAHHPRPRAYVAMSILTLVLMVGALLFGGATREGDFVNAVVRLLSLPVLVLAIGRLVEARPSRELVFLAALLAGIIAVPLIQLIPLPPEVWSALPGRAEFAQTYRDVGMQPPWLPISLNRDGTLNALLALLPGAAMFLSVATLDSRSRRSFLPWVMVIVAASVALGMAQIAEGPESGLRLYSTTNASAAVGFFANRNHQAALLLAAMPLTAAWIRDRLRRASARRPLMVGLGLGLLVALAAGVAVAESRAGLMLLGPVAIGCAMMVFGARLPRLSLRMILAGLVAVALVALLTLRLGLFHTLADMPPALEGELRLKVAPAIIKAALGYMPTGSGLGTFDPIYRMVEQTRGNAFLNHAHNDYLELWLETGLVAAVLLVAFLGWFVRAAPRAWRRAEGNDLARAATIVIGLLLVHSLVDYPLRTAAISVLFAYACACLTPPPASPETHVAEVMPSARPPSRRRRAAG